MQRFIKIISSAGNECSDCATEIECICDYISSAITDVCETVTSAEGLTRTQRDYFFGFETALKVLTKAITAEAQKITDILNKAEETAHTEALNVPIVKYAEETQPQNSATGDNVAE